MYTGKHAYLRPLQAAFIMANSGETVTYAELEARNNRLADRVIATSSEVAKMSHFRTSPLVRSTNAGFRPCRLPVRFAMLSFGINGPR